MKLKNLLLVIMLVPFMAQAKHKEPLAPAQVSVNAPADVVSSECVKLFVQRGFTLTSEAAHFLVFERKMSPGRAAFSSLIIGNDGGDARDVVKLTLIPGNTVTVVANYYIPGRGTTLDMSTDKKQKAGLQIALDIIKGNAERSYNDSKPAVSMPPAWQANRTQPGLDDPGFGGTLGGFRGGSAGAAAASSVSAAGFGGGRAVAGPVMPDSDVTAISETANGVDVVSKGAKEVQAAAPKSAAPKL